MIQNERSSDYEGNKFPTLGRNIDSNEKGVWFTCVVNYWRGSSAVGCSHGGVGWRMKAAAVS